jgi:hypothetical protein
VDGNIISYDGSHLTPYGARVLGSQLKALVLKQENFQSSNSTEPNLSK